MLGNILGESPRHESHLTFPERDAKSGNARFTPGRHDVHFLADIVRKNAGARGKYMSPLQKTAWKKLKPDKLSAPDPGVSMHSLLEECFHLFDDLFFFGTVTGYCTVYFSNSKLHETVVDRNVHGVTVTRGYSGLRFWKWGQSKMQIIIYSRAGENKWALGGTLTAWYIETLLHEMWHAFADRWGCRSCRNRQENMGWNGHGPAFQVGAHALEVAVNEIRFVDRKLSLDREVSWALEVRVEELCCLFFLTKSPKCSQSYY